MNEQQNAALQAMKKWLSHPGELGREPAKIELAGEFDLYDMHYYMFKYKKGVLGKWLLGVCGGFEPGELEHCGHVYSEMEPYDPADAQEKAIAMVEMLRQYWMDRAKEYQEGDSGAGKDGDPDEKEESDPAGAFTGFALLSEPRWNPEQFEADMKEEWGIDCRQEKDEADEEDDGGEDDGTIRLYSIDGMQAAVALMEAPIPGKEAEVNAANNYMWPEAVEKVKSHTAHLMVAILGQDVPLRERGCLFTKVLAACCKQEAVLGIYTSGTVFQPEFYLEASGIMKEGELPVLNWIYFGLYKTENGWNAYTYGMRTFGMDEMEVLNVKAEPEELQSFLLNLVYYVLDEDVTLQDGETIGFSEDQKLPITRSEGVSLDGFTLKVGCGI